MTGDQLTPHFKLDEFRCPCCSKVDPVAALKLAEQLEPVRADIGPVVILSSFRCPAHNAAVGGEPDSAHLCGLAADIACAYDDERYLLVKSLVENFFFRIGIKNGAVHADIMPQPAPEMWLYPVQPATTTH